MVAIVDLHDISGATPGVLIFAHVKAVYLPGDHSLDCQDLVFALITRKPVELIELSCETGTQSQTRTDTNMPLKHVPLPLGYLSKLVVQKGLEPSWITPHGPQPCAYANSATAP